MQGINLVRENLPRVSQDYVEPSNVRDSIGILVGGLAQRYLPRTRSICILSDIRSTELGGARTRRTASQIFR